jgi:hypothetical protein
MMMTCSRLGFTSEDLPGQAGDCQYLVVKEALQLDESVKVIRLIVYNWLINNLDRDEWAPSKEGECITYESYLQEVKKSGYGDEHTLIAMANFYRFFRKNPRCCSRM